MGLDILDYRKYLIAAHSLFLQFMGKINDLYTCHAITCFPLTPATVI